MNILRVNILILLFFSTGAFSGMVVTDPSSYAYYVEQIKTAAEGVKKATEQVNSLKEIYETNTQTLNQLKGVYRSSRTAVSALTDRIEAAKRVKSSIEKWRKKTENGDFVDAAEIMKDIFRDPREDPDTVWRDAEKRYEAEQTAVKGVITDADGILNGMPARFDIVQELLSEIGRTENIKAAMDLQNRISVEMLQVLLEMLNFSAKVAQAEAMISYTGVSATAMEKRMKEQAEAGKNRTVAWMDEWRKNMKKKRKEIERKNK